MSLDARSDAHLRWNYSFRAYDFQGSNDACDNSEPAATYSFTGP